MEVSYHLKYLKFDFEILVYLGVMGHFILYEIKICKSNVLIKVNE